MNIGGPRFLFLFLSSYACSRGPSPCSHPCICTCMSPACCSRWRSCCSGSVLESTHPHLKENGSKTFSCGARMKRLRQNRENQRVSGSPYKTPHSRSGGLPANALKWLSLMNVFCFYLPTIKRQKEEPSPPQSQALDVLY